MILLFLAAWEVVDKGDHWLVEKRKVDDLDEVRVSASSKVSPKRVFETAWNLREQAGYAPHLKQVVILSESPAKVVAYQQISVPLVADRDYVIEATNDIVESAQLYQIFVRAAPPGTGPAPGKGMVRMRHIRSDWTFEPDAKGGTLVTLLSYGDPGGQVPTWIVRLASTRGPADFVRAVVKRAEEAR